MSDLERENARLRERIAQLESEHAIEVARLHQTLATAQERVYWLDRWHIDLNRWMATKYGAYFRQALRGARTPVRAARMAVRKAKEQR